jgi:hypothetical protein
MDLSLMPYQYDATSVRHSLTKKRSVSLVPSCYSDAETQAFGASAATDRSSSAAPHQSKVPITYAKVNRYLTLLFVTVAVL